MTDEPTAAPAPDPTPPAAEPAAAVPARWRVLRWVPGRRARWAVIAGFGLFAAGIVSLVTIDLGPAVRAQAESAASSRLGRAVRIGRLGTYVLPGRFLVEDLVIDGLSPGDDPFLSAERIVVSTSWVALLRGEILIDGAEMAGWRMLVESFPDGRHSFPAFATRRSPPPAEAADAREEAPPGAETAPGEGALPADASPRRSFVTTLSHLLAHDGEFVFRDHGAPWTVTARNIDLTIAKRDGYGGEVSFRGGTVRIGSFEPMTVAMDATYALDGGLVDLTDIRLTMDGFTSELTGQVDLLNWPEQTYRIVDSDIDLPPMKDIFFADQNFTVTGGATFTGTWHIFDGGRELAGAFRSANAELNGLRFPGIEGSLVWTADRFEVFDGRSPFYGGALEFGYSMQPLGGTTPGRALLDTVYSGVDLAALVDDLPVGGVRPRGRASGRNVLGWPLGAFAERLGDGQLSVTPIPAARLMTRADPTAGPADADSYAATPFAGRGGRWSFPVGGAIAYSVDPAGIELQPSRLATPYTEIEFQGRTAYGGRSRIPFRVTSADWQESDRLMAAFMTAFGAPTQEIAVGGRGQLEGVMLGTFASPRIEASFDGQAISAWNVPWGAGRGTITVENGYLDVSDTRFVQGDATLEIDGRFALGGRGDGQDEIDASFEVASFPAQRVRRAFDLSGYDINGPLTGAIRLFGSYRRPYGVGRLTLDQPQAYGETFDAAAAGLRFEGTGVRIEGLEVRKGGGLVTGAAFIGWDGTYSFNAAGRGIAVTSLDAARVERVPLGGRLRFTVDGVGAFDDPRYEVRGAVRDLTIGGEVVGSLSGRIDVRGGVMGLEAEASSPRGAVSGSGRVELATTRSELLLRFSDATIDPYVRAFQPALPQQLTAEVSGTLQVLGPLRDIGALEVASTIEQLQLDVYGYTLRNDRPLRLALERNVVDVERMRLTGDGTAIDLTGSIDLGGERLALEATGDGSLGFLQQIFPDLRGSGHTRLAARIGGSLQQPLVTGEAAVDGGRIRHLSFPHGLENIAGRIVFEPYGLRFDELTGELGAGPVQFGGRVGLRGYALDELSVTATGTGLRLRFPEGVRSLVDAELALGGSADAPVLSGAVDVRDAVLLELFEPSTGLLDFGPDETLSQPVDPAFPLRLDVRISAPSTLRISDNAARVVSSAELTLGGTYAQPQLFGNAEIERGEVFFEGNRYRVTRGSIGFASPTAIEPFFDIEAETDVRAPGQTYRVTLGVVGTMERLGFELSSDPPLPEFEIMSLLLGNIRDPQAAELRTLRALDESRQELFQAGAARLLTSPLSSGVGRVVEESFGVDTFQITPSLVDPSAQQSAQLLPTARLLIGKRISDRAHVTLSRTLTGANQDIIVVLEYDQNDRLSWILSQNEDRTYALDFRVRHAF